MPSATFGVLLDWGGTYPDGYTQEISREISAETATIKDVDGKTVVATNKPRTVTTVTIKAKGQVDLADISLGTKNGGSFFVSAAKYSETNDDFATSEVTSTMYG